MSPLSSKFDSGEQMTLDLLWVEDGDPALREKQRVTLEDVAASVVSRAILSQMKATAARPQDLADIDKLEELDR